MIMIETTPSRERPWDNLTRSALNSLKQNVDVKKTPEKPFGQQLDEAVLSVQKELESPKKRHWETIKESVNRNKDNKERRGDISIEHWYRGSEIIGSYGQKTVIFPVSSQEIKFLWAKGNDMVVRIDPAKGAEEMQRIVKIANMMNMLQNYGDLIKIDEEGKVFYQRDMSTYGIRKDILSFGSIHWLGIEPKVLYTYTQALRNQYGERLYDTDNPYVSDYLNPQK